MMEKLKEKVLCLLNDKERLRELCSYVFFGVLTTVVNYAAYWLLTLALGLDAEKESYHAIASICTTGAWILSVLFAYVVNKRFVFKSNAKAQNAWKEFGLFVSARVLSYLVFDLALFNLGLLFMNDKVDKLLMNVFVVVFNYVASKLVIFKKGNDTKN